MLIEPASQCGHFPFASHAIPQCEHVFAIPLSIAMFDLSFIMPDLFSLAHPAARPATTRARAATARKRFFIRNSSTFSVSNRAPLNTRRNLAATTVSRPTQPRLTTAHKEIPPHLNSLP